MKTLTLKMKEYFLREKVNIGYLAGGRAAGVKGRRRVEKGLWLGVLKANLDSWVLITLLKHSLKSLTLLPMGGGVYRLSP